VSGIHHITAISGNASRNNDFYTRVLGLRFVKKTVNFDDPTTYHLYYGDETGQPGTILTFFPWEHAAAGRSGVGHALETAFAVPASSIGFWTHRFVERGVAHDPPSRRFDQSVLAFTDPDGMRLALVGTGEAQNEPVRSQGRVPPEHAIRGFFGVTLLLEDGGATSAILTDVLGFRPGKRDGALVRFGADAAIGNHVDIREAQEFLPGRMGRGSVHHIAFRVKDDAMQARMARKLTRDHGVPTTEQIDRQYFRSVYFREPGGLLFELATDQPGFLVDESAENLGHALKLPPFLESRRAELEASLPPLEARA
jgi:glyoxalase family protein